MSLELDGVWKGGLWAPTVWASGIWAAGAQASPNVNDGAWRKLTGEYPKPRRRKKPAPQVAPLFPLHTTKPAPQPAPRSAPQLRVVVSGDSPYREQLLGELAAPVPRETVQDQDYGLAIALLLAA